jgi:hypothetical protein
MHSVQLFDDAADLAAQVTEFVRDALGLNGNVILAITSDHWARVSRRLTQRGLNVRALISENRLTVLDARRIADAVESELPGQIDREAFEQIVGTMVRGRARAGSLFIYGEVVNLFAARGDFDQAVALESAWNELLTQVPATLFCGYSSAHFGDPRTAAALRRVCATHSHVKQGTSQGLGDWLVSLNATT